MSGTSSIRALELMLTSIFMHSVSESDSSSIPKMTLRGLLIFSTVVMNQ